MSNIREAALLIARILLGVILFAHGWDKFQITGLEGISGYFESIGVPAAGVAAPVVGAIEIIGGILLILGLFTRITGIVVALLMLGAAVFAHIEYGIFVADGGWELVGAIGAGFLTFAAVGAGKWSIDHLIAARRNTTSPATDPAFA